MRLLVVVLAALVVAGCGGGASAASAACPDVELVFARGSGEKQGLGQVGAPLLLRMREQLPDLDIGAYAVRYGAAFNQTTAGPGATDLTTHVRRRAAACRKTRFVLGGYSQGASVVDIAVGMTPQLGSGKRLPRRLSKRIAALVVFGNPARRFGQRLDRDSGVYAKKSLDDCNRGDPVCAAGTDFSRHLAYDDDDSVPAAVTFICGRLVHSAAA